MKMNDYITTDSSWTIDDLKRFDEEIAKIAHEELKLDTYENQIEVISSEQMIDLYSLNGLPLSYDHWKFGKSFVGNWNQYQQGRKGLAYEIVINSSPTISYNMEDNTSAMMAMVLAHAAYGHNHFFKNNYMFKEWTDASFIIDYMKFAKNYIDKCERKYGFKEVEKTLDACHAIMYNSVDFHPRKKKVKKEDEDESYLRYDDVWEKTSGDMKQKGDEDYDKPEENLLYFLEKNAEGIENWQREIMRIVRKMAQYFYPQMLTKVTNEGTASFVHYHIMVRLHEKGLINDSFYMEFLHHHSNVIYQPQYGKDINPYTLGFNILMDIKRICQEPTDEDREWFPQLAGNDWLEEVHFAMENFRDESLILQYLSPKVIRDMGLFHLKDHDEDNYIVENIHNAQGYRNIRQKLAGQYVREAMIPNIVIEGIDNQTLKLNYDNVLGKELHEQQKKKTLMYVKYLWGGFPVEMV